MSVRLEMAARSLWSGWGEFRRHTVCDECGGHRYCHAARRRGRWLCLDCFDVSADADRFAAELHDRLYGRLLAASGGDSVQAEHVAETVERVRA